MRILVAGLIVSAGSVLVSAQEPTRITSASNVRLRAAPSDGAAVVATLPLGTELVQLESGGEGGSWTRVRLPVHANQALHGSAATLAFMKRASDSERVGGAERGSWGPASDAVGGAAGAKPPGFPLDGWLPTRLTRSLVKTRRADAIDSILQERLARKGDGFAARAELADFVERELKLAPDPETAGRLALAWVRAMSATLEAVPLARGTRPPYKSWLTSRANAVVYNEPGGRWIIRVNRLWALHDEHARTSSADEIAWAAVLNGAPGECEGFMPCHLQRRNLLEGEYLRRSALGRHVDEAVARVAGEASRWPVPLQKPYFFDPAKDCGELVQALDPLRAALSTTRADGLQIVLDKMDKLRRTCPAPQPPARQP
jgi:hypothetical protein